MARIHLRSCSLLLLLLLICSAVPAQQYNFKNYTAKNGLAGSSVNNIFQDSKGYLWFGTQGGGVSRFDYKTFVNYSKKEGLVGNDVTFVTEDKKGNIWIATTEGASMFDGVNFKNYTEKEGLAKGTVYSIFCDKDNILWFAVQDGGLNRFDGKTFKAYTTKDGLPSNNVYSIVQDNKGDLWMGISNGIAKFDGTRITSYDKQAESNNKTFFSSLLDSRGNVWFGGANQNGVLKYDGKTFQPLDLPAEVANDFIGSIAEDKFGNLWFATDHGVLKYNGRSYTLFNEKQGLSSNAVLSVNKDYEGNIWIGTLGGGVNLFSNEAFVNYTEKDGLSSNKISNILHTKDGSYVIGTLSAGINIFENGSFSHLASVPQLQQSNILSVAAGDDDQLWVGTQFDGVFVLKKQGKDYTVLRQIRQLNGIDILAAVKLIRDKKGDMWIATFSAGLFRIAKDKVTHYTAASGLGTDNLLTLYTDAQDRLWIGTYDAGVLLFDKEKFSAWSEKEGLADNSVWSIAGDQKGNMYFGTGEGGLSCYDGKQFKTLDQADGLCSNYIPALQWDHIEDCLWLGTNNGVNKLKLKENFDIASLRLYSEQEGFKGIEVNQNALLLDNNGYLWLGTINGLSKYNRAFDVPRTTAPKLHLNNIQLFYQDVDWKQYTDEVDPKTHLPVSLNLSHRNNNLTFHFQALTADNVQYSFMLEGQDEDWSPLTSNTQAVFSNITSGRDYTFRVKAVNSNGIWSEDVIAFRFSVAPPWWQTWWFYTLAVLLIVVTVYAFINYRTAQLAKEKKILEDKVTERTMELKGANDKLSVAFNDIKDSINYAKKIQDAILPLDEEIRRALPQSFVLFKPRDVVSGDFYWFNKKDDRIYIAAVDCTGHGVPGAFMSMIGNSLLNEIVSKKGTHEAADILKKLHQGVRKALKQDRNSYESKDGMDLALAVIDTSSNTLQYAGAKRSLFRFSEGIFTEIKADKQSIGGLEMEDDYHFTNHNFPLKKGDTFYLFTDGYVDQFGGAHEKKYSTKRLKETLAELQPLPMTEQGRRLESIIDEWKSEVEQIDDILVVGLRF